MVSTDIVRQQSAAEIE